MFTVPFFVFCFVCLQLISLCSSIVVLQSCRQIIAVTLLVVAALAHASAMHKTNPHVKATTSAAFYTFLVRVGKRITLDSTHFDFYDVPNLT